MGCAKKELHQFGSMYSKKMISLPLNAQPTHWRHTHAQTILRYTIVLCILISAPPTYFTPCFSTPYVAITVLILLRSGWTMFAIGRYLLRLVESRPHCLLVDSKSLLGESRCFIVESCHYCCCHCIVVIVH